MIAFVLWMQQRLIAGQDAVFQMAVYAVPVLLAIIAAGGGLIGKMVWKRLDHMEGRIGSTFDAVSETRGKVQAVLSYVELVAPSLFHDITREGPR